MLTQKDVSRLQDKLKSLPVPTCTRCHGTDFATIKGITFCVECGNESRVLEKV